MEKKRVTIIDYIDGHYFNEDGTVMPTIKSEAIVMNSVKRYYNCIYLLAGLRPATRNLMDFLTEEMDKDNIVYNNQIWRSKFIFFMKEITSKFGENEKTIIYTDQTVKDSFAQLTKTGLINPIARGMFKVNPKYFFIDEDNKRLTQIKMELEFNSTSTNFNIISIKEK